MSALNEIAKIKKSKLKTFQRVINALRSGLLGNKTIEEWKGLSDSERKLKITVFLCMAMIPEKDLERMVKILNPWWEPYQIAAKVLAAVLVLFLSYQVATFFLAERVYPKVFENDVTFTDGSVKKYGLFDGSSMIYMNTSSGAVLLEDGLFYWLIKKNKTTPFDSTKWTTVKKLNEELNYFYGGFRNNAMRFGELKSVPLSIEEIYQATANVSGIRQIKMDIFVPPDLANKFSPILFYPQIGEFSFFLSASDGTNYWNIKIYFKDSFIVSAEQILFSPLSLPENKNKVIWDKNPNLTLPGLNILFKDSAIQLSRNYILKYPDRPFAE